MISKDPVWVKRKFYQSINGYRKKDKTAWDNAEDICNPDERIYESNYEEI